MVFLQNQVFSSKTVSKRAPLFFYIMLSLLPFSPEQERSGKQMRAKQRKPKEQNESCVIVI